MAFKRIRWKRGTWAQWVEANPVLRLGEPGYVTSGENANSVKVGDGVRNFLDLPFLAGGASYTDEQAQDAAAALFASGTHTNITFTYDDPGNRINVVAEAGYTDEQAQDAAAALFAAGTHTNITFTYDDAGNRINAAASAGYTDEEAQDAAAALFTDGIHSGIAFSYDDANDRMNAVVTVGGLGGGTITDEIVAEIAVTSEATPCGSIVWLKRTGTPVGWLRCTGQIKSRTQYPSIFAVIGTTYGDGDGSTTFRIPARADLENPFADRDDVVEYNPFIKVCVRIGDDGGVVVATNSSETQLLTYTATLSGLNARPAPTVPNMGGTRQVALSSDASIAVYASAITAPNPGTDRVFGFNRDGASWAPMTGFLVTTNKAADVPLAGVGLSPDGQYLAVNYQEDSLTRTTEIYKFNGTTYSYLTFFTQTLPSPLLSTAIHGRNIRWSPDGTYLFVVTNSSQVPGFLYQRSGDTFTFVGNAPAAPNSHKARDAGFTPDNNFLVVRADTDGAGATSIFAYAPLTSAMTVVAYGFNSFVPVSDLNPSPLGTHFIDTSFWKFNGLGPTLTELTNGFNASSGGSLPNLLTARWITGLTADQNFISGSSLYKVDPGGNTYSYVGPFNFAGASFPQKVMPVGIIPA